MTQNTDKTYPSVGLKNLKKNIFNVLEANLDKNLILEKKVTKFTPKYRNSRYF